MQIFTSPAKAQWPSIIRRPAIDNRSLESTVDTIIQDVRANGDSAVKKYAALFDGIAPTDLLLSENEFQFAKQEVPEELRSAIAVAKNNITHFHEAQLQSPEIIET